MGYLFIAPWLLSFFAFTLIPILASLVLAFTDYDVLGSWNWVGLENFERMFTSDPRYIKSIKATFYYVFAAVPLRLAFALMVAMLLNTNRRGVGTYRAVYTVKFKEAVFVLHCFQKKSKRGIATPKADMDIIRARLKVAEALAQELRDGKENH